MPRKPNYKDLLKKFKKRNRFWYYDLLLLDVLKSTKGNGYKEFGYMFKEN